MSRFDEANAKILAGPDGPAKRFLQAYLEKKHGCKPQALPLVPAGGAPGRDQGHEPDLFRQAAVDQSQEGTLDAQSRLRGLPGLPHIDEAEGDQVSGPMTDWDLPMNPAEDDKHWEY